MTEKATPEAEAAKAAAPEAPAAEAPAGDAPETPEQIHEYRQNLSPEEDMKFMSGEDVSPQEPKEPVEEKAEDKPAEPEPEKAPEATQADTPDKKPEAPATDKPPATTSDEPVTIAGTVYANQAVANKAMEEAQKLIGRQGEELGTLRAKTAEHEAATKPDPDPDPGYDDLDPKPWIEWHTRQSQRAQKSSDAREQQQQIQRLVEAENRQFMDSNPDMTIGKMKAVAAIRGERGCSYDDALVEWDKANPAPDNKPNGQVPDAAPVAPAAAPAEAPDLEAAKKQEAAQKVAPTLSGGAGGGELGVDVSKMTPDQLHKYRKTLTPEQDMRFMSGEEV